jgi:hypothetical protein
MQRSGKIQASQRSHHASIQDILFPDVIPAYHITARPPPVDDALIIAGSRDMGYPPRG